MVVLLVRFSRIGSVAPVKRHYEKAIVACCCIAMFVNVGLGITAFAVYQPYIVSMSGIGDTAGSVILSTRILVSAAATMLVTRFYDLLDIRAGLVLTMALTGAAFFVYAAASNVSEDLRAWGLALKGVSAFWPITSPVYMQPVNWRWEKPADLLVD